MEDIRLQATEQNGEKERPLRYEDFLAPNPFVRPWMLAYLPNNQRLRDFVVAFIGCAIAVTVAMISYLSGFSALVVFIIAGIGVFVFQADMLNRHTLAGMDYGKAKRKAKDNNR